MIKQEPLWPVNLQQGRVDSFADTLASVLNAAAPSGVRRRTEGSFPVTYSSRENGGKPDSQFPVRLARTPRLIHSCNILVFWHYFKSGFGVYQSSSQASFRKIRQREKIEEIMWATGVTQGHRLCPFFFSLLTPPPGDVIRHHEGAAASLRWTKPRRGNRLPHQLLAQKQQMDEQ